LGIAFQLLARFLMLILFLIIIWSFIFIIMLILPGDPIAGAVLPSEAPQEAIQYLRKELGLDLPPHIRYINYMTKILTGDLGFSWSQKRSVYDVISSAMPTTIELTIFSMIVAFSISQIIAFLSIVKMNTFFENLLNLYNIVILSTPVVVIGPILQYVFGIWLNVLPVSGKLDPWIIYTPRTGFVIIDCVLDKNLICITNYMSHMILPTITLGMIFGSFLAVVTKNSMIQTLKEDYVTAALAKGLTTFYVLRHYVYRNAIFPVVTIMSLEAGSLLAGAIVTETIYNLPGMGRLIYTGFLSRDLPLVSGCLVFSTILIGILLFIMDLIYILLDPRAKRI
jgi:peptide/nickel transport system permease protein